MNSEEKEAESPESKRARVQENSFTEILPMDNSKLSLEHATGLVAVLEMILSRYSITCGSKAWLKDRLRTVEGHDDCML